jgi:hypothetical protein
MTPERKRWLEREGSVTTILRVLCGIALLLLLTDLVLHRHGHYGFEVWFGFYAFYGFVACTLLVLAARELRKLLMRDENYYGEEDYPDE